MAAKYTDEFQYARSDRNVDATRHPLPRSHFPVSNRPSLNESSSLPPAASRHDRAEVVYPPPRARESSHQPLDTNGHRSSYLAQAQEGDQVHGRSQEAKDQRFAEPIKWVFDQDYAEAYSRAIHWGCVKDHGLEKTVKKLERAELITDDGSEGGALVRYYINTAKMNQDPTFLLKAYTVESQFYRGLNEYMATGNSKKVFEKLRGKWSGYYTGMIMKNPAFQSYYFAGTTYRGMQVAPEQIGQYELGVALANKAFQSTSRLKSFALTFACPENPKRETKPVIITYTILDRRSGLYIKSLSDYPEEEEVLLVPGTLFMVDNIDTSREPFEFQLRQLPWDD